MDAEIRAALRHGQVIDITTTGRRTGAPRRLEIVFHVFDGRIYISGMPSRRTRAWIHNLAANPRLTLHLRRPRVDVPATARVISDETERRAILPRVAAVWRRPDAEVMIAHSPLIEVTVDEGETG